MEGNFVWLKPTNENFIPEKLKHLPVKNTYIVDEQNFLFEEGRLTPVDKLKDLNWQSLDEFIKPGPPVAAMPGKIENKIPVRLVKSDLVRQSVALLVKLDQWKTFGETAADTRLGHLRFAVSENNEVLILGNPLPALPGKEYWIFENILLPCGYEFEFPIVSGFINQHNEKDTLLLFHETGNWQRIDTSFFVQAKRSAIRLTKK